MDIIIILLLVVAIGMIVILGKKYVPQKGSGVAEYKKESFLYKVKPLVNETGYWEDLSEITNIRKQKKLSFESVQDKQLLANFLTGRDLCKLYIVDEDTVEMLYVPSNSLNPIGTVKVAKGKLQ